MELDLTKGSVLKKLILFAVPFFLANLLQALYGAVDFYVIGQFHTSVEIAAVNIGSQTMLIASGFIIGLAMGVTVVVGNYIGQNNKEGVCKALGNSILLFAILGIVVTPIMIFLTKQIVIGLQTPAESIDEASSYVRICSFALPFIIIYNLASALLRGIGDSKTPLIIVFIACLINVGLDFLFVVAFDLSTLGVAYATAIAQVISSIVALIVVVIKFRKFGFSKNDIKLNSLCSEIVKIGLPIAIQDTLINLSFIFLTVIANNRGVIDSSAVGVVEKLIHFMFLIPSSMFSSLSAFTAQNMGAGLNERAHKGLLYSIIICLSIGSVLCLMANLIPRELCSIFTNEEDVINAGEGYLRTYSTDLIVTAFTFSINGYLCGASKSMIVFVHNTLATFLCRIPFAYLFSKKSPDSLLPMGIASPIGSFFSLVFLIVYFFIEKKQKRNIISEQN